MIAKINYFSSVIMGVFVGSVILFVSRLINLPISGIMLAIVASSFVTTFLYNPTAKKKNNNRTLRGVSASIIFSLIFTVMLLIYYIPKLGNIFASTDVTLSVSIGIILLIILLGGLIIGSIAGSIGSTFRDLYALILSERK